jgi:trans-aconitate methyltransferase
MLKNKSDQVAYGSKKKNKKEIYKKILKILKKKNYKNVLDIGCGNGDLLQFLSNNFPKVNFTGIDLNSNFFPKKKKNNCRYLKKNIMHFSSAEKYDFITAIGVAGYSIDYLRFLNRILKFSEKTSTVIVEGAVNFNGYDVKIKFRNYKIKNQMKWESGFDQISVNRLKSFLNHKNLNHKFINWNFPISIVHKKNAPKIRARTLKDANGRYWIYNGLNIITHGYKNNFLNSYCSLLKIEKNDEKD